MKEILENRTAHRLTGICPHCKREHGYLPIGRKEAAYFLFLTVEDMDKKEGVEAIRPMRERVNRRNRIRDRRGNDISDHISKLRRYPGYNPDSGKIERYDDQGRITRIDISDVTPLSEDQELKTVTYKGETIDFEVTRY